MGKLTASNQDLQQLIKAFGPEKQMVRCDANSVELKIGAVELLVTDVDSHGKIQHQGVQFDCHARYQNGTLEIDFE